VARFRPFPVLSIVIVIVLVLAVAVATAGTAAVITTVNTDPAPQAPALQQPAGRPVLGWNGIRSLTVRSTSPVAPTRRAAPTRTPLRYHGGPVMTGPVRLYVIWYGAWARKTRRRAIITDFLTHLAGPRFAINQTYPDASGATVSNSVTLAGQWFDHGSVGKRQVTDTAISAIVASALAERRLPADPQGIYLVLTSTEVDKTGFLTRYCGWHSHGRWGATSIKFVLVGDPSGPRLRRCAPQGVGPNGDPGADAMVNVLAHEIDETVTDPEFTGWFDDAHEENADRCSWSYGTSYRVRRAKANIRLGRRHFYVQTNWVNDTGAGCALSAAARAPRKT